jgi:hypothetical protein
MTPTISITPSITPTNTKTPTITPTVTRTPTSSPQPVFCYARQFNAYTQTSNFCNYGCPATGATFTAYVRKSTGALSVNDRLYYIYGDEPASESACLNDTSNAGVGFSWLTAANDGDPANTFTDQYACYFWYSNAATNYYNEISSVTNCP